MGFFSKLFGGIKRVAGKVGGAIKKGVQFVSNIVKPKVETDEKAGTIEVLPAGVPLRKRKAPIDTTTPIPWDTMIKADKAAPLPQVPYHVRHITPQTMKPSRPKEDWLKSG
jgi:hypothetical protein